MFIKEEVWSEDDVDGDDIADTYIISDQDDGHLIIDDTRVCIYIVY